MCDHSPNRERAMVVTHPGIYHRDADDQRTTIIPGVWCDPCLEPLIRALNDGGMPTVASCCGHGRWLGWIALADDRVLVPPMSRETYDQLQTIGVQ